MVPPAGGPSRTALLAAAARAAHLLVDVAPLIFTDSLAVALLGDSASELLSTHRQQPAHPVLAAARTQAVCRARFTEDTVAAAVTRGVDQYVILGAGLDTFATRSPLARHLRVFEVDQPVTQRWKREAVTASTAPRARDVRWVPVDLESDPLGDALADAGFDPTRRAVISWLGVTMYLSRASVVRIFEVVGGFAAGSELVAEYLLPAGLRDRAGDVFAAEVGLAAAAAGEPWRTFLHPRELSALLSGCGFETVTHRPQRDALDQRLWQRTDALRPCALSMLVHATVGAQRSGRRAPPR